MIELQMGLRDADSLDPAPTEEANEEAPAEQPAEAPPEAPPEAPAEGPPEEEERSRG
jgi:hypothetical protein